MRLNLFGGKPLDPQIMKCSQRTVSIQVEENASSTSIFSMLRMQWQMWRRTVSF